MNTKNKLKNILFNSLKYGLISILTAIIGFISIPILTRLLTPSDYGRINMFFSTSSLIITFVFLGLDSAFIRFYNEGDNNYKNVLRRKIIQIAIFVLISISIPLLIFFRNGITTLLFGTKNNIILIILIAYSLILIAFRMLSLEFRMAQKAANYNLLNFLNVFSTRIVLVITVLINNNYLLILLIITFSMMLCIVPFMIKKGMKTTKVKMNYRVLLGYSLPLLPAVMLISFNTTIPKFMLSNLGEYDLVGFFAVSSSIANIFAIVPAGFSIYWSSYMFANYKNESSTIKLVHKYIMLFSIIMTLALVLGIDLLKYFVGDIYKEALIILPLIISYPLQSLINETTSYGISISKKTWWNILISFIVVVINIGLSYLLIPKLGLMGAGISVAISSFFSLLIHLFVGQKYYKSISSYISTLLAIMIIIMLIVSYYLGDFIKEIFIVTALILLVLLYIKDIKKSIQMIKRRIT